MYDLHGRSQRMIGPEGLANLSDWLSDHPTVYSPSDGMLVASAIYGEVSTQILYGRNAAINGTAASFIVAELRGQLRSWRAKWFSDTCKSACAAVKVPL